MKAFITDLVNRIHRTSITLDVKAIICNKTWRIFNDTGEKEVYIFMEDGNLIISVNGNAIIGSWMYIPANQSLVISGNKQNFLVHPIFCNGVLVLALDGSNQCCFLIDSTKVELENIQSLTSIESYIYKNANIIPPITLNKEGTAVQNVVIQKPVPTDAIYATDPRLMLYNKCIWNESHTSGTYYERLYIKGMFTYKKFTGTIYTSKLHYKLEYIKGRMSRTYMYHLNNQIAIELICASDEDECIYFYDENGHEISEEDWNLRYANMYDIYKSEADEFNNIPNGGYKD